MEGFSELSEENHACLDDECKEILLLSETNQLFTCILSRKPHQENECKRILSINSLLSQEAILNFVRELVKNKPKKLKKSIYLPFDALEIGKRELPFETLNYGKKRASSDLPFDFIQYGKRAMPFETLNYGKRMSALPFDAIGIGKRAMPFETLNYGKRAPIPDGYFLGKRYYVGKEGSK